MIEMIMNDPSIIENMCNCIIRNKKDGIYDGAYNAVKLAAAR